MPATTVGRGEWCGMNATPAICRPPQIGATITARRLMMFQWLTGSLAILSACLPQYIQGLIWACCVLTLSDTLTGCMISRRKGVSSSGKMRRMTAEKAGQFLTILALGTAGSLGVGDWVPFGLSLSAIIAIEVASNIENLAWLEHHGGAPLGPARPFLLKISQTLGLGPVAVEEEKK